MFAELVSPGTADSSGHLAFNCYGGGYPFPPGSCISDGYSPEGGQCSTQGVYPGYGICAAGAKPG